MQSGIKTALASQPAQSLRQSHAAIAITHARVAALAARTTFLSSGWIHGLLAPPFWACSSHLAPVSGLIQILRVDGLICPDHWGPITRLYSDGNTQPVHSTYPPPTKGPWYRSHPVQVGHGFIGHGRRTHLRWHPCGLLTAVGCMAIERAARCSILLTPESTTRVPPTTLLDRQRLVPCIACRDAQASCGRGMCFLAHADRVSEST